MIKFSANVDVCCRAVHGTTGNETAFDKLVWILAHNFAVFAGARFALVSVDNEVAGLGILVPVFEVHEGLHSVSLYA